MLGELEPVDRLTAAQAVANQLLGMLRRGVLKPGDRFPTEKALMERLGVGRSSVREALQILAAHKIVSAVPGQGTFVREPQASEVFRADVIGVLIGPGMARELLEARETIEPQIVRLACRNATDDDLAAIEALLARHEADLAAGRPITQHAARFHILLAEAAHNRVLLGFMQSILDLLLERGQKIEDTPGYAEAELAEHRELFGLVRARDADAASLYLFEHLIHSAMTCDADEIAGDGTLTTTTLNEEDAA